MTTFKHPRGKTYQYDFWWRGKRHTGTTGQLTKAAADAVEAKVKERVREDAYGVAPFDRMRTPSFQPGPLAPEEDGVYQFVTHMAQAYLGRDGS